LVISGFEVTNSRPNRLGAVSGPHAVRYHDDCAEAHNRLGIVLLQRGRVRDGSVHFRAKCPAWSL